MYAGLVQVVVLLWAYALYDILRVSVTGTMAASVAHAQQLLTVERFLGLNVEPFLQQQALQQSWLVGLCNLVYMLTHLAVPPLVLFLLYRRSPARYRHWRNVFFVLLALGVLCFWLYPMAPPRLLHAPDGLVDTSHGYVTLKQTALAPLTAPAAAPAWTGDTNPFAAMPSLHVGWATWAALAGWPVLRRRRTRVLLVSYPVAMLVAVVVTGNHWLLDCVAGVAAPLVALGIVVAAASLRARAPTPWRASLLAAIRAGAG
jgi:hypothetical protein